MTQPLDGKAITYHEQTNQYGHGQDFVLQIGESKDAIKVHFDDKDFVRDSKYTFNAFDAWDHTNRPL